MEHYLLSTSFIMSKACHTYIFLPIVTWIVHIHAELYRSWNPGVMQIYLEQLVHVHILNNDHNMDRLLQRLEEENHIMTYVYTGSNLQTWWWKLCFSSRYI